MANKYVKFERGSQAAYDALKQAGKLDNDTLYFIYSEDNGAVGALYMGTRIISGGDITIASATLDELADVVVAGAETNSFLVKDGDNWIAKSLTDVIALIKENISDVASPAQVFQGILGADENADAAISRLVGDKSLTAGDIVVLKKLISNEKYEYTAYVYDGKAWAAMDGNYNASSVYFDSDLVLTEKVGSQDIPASGSITLATTGKNMRQVFDMLYGSRKLPEKVEPKIAVVATESKAYEVGTKITPSYTATLSAGSYSYGPATGIEATAWKATFGEKVLDTATGAFDEVVVDDAMNTRIEVVATYGEGAVPLDNLGNVITDPDELEQCQIAAGSAQGNGGYITGFRKVFYGSKVVPVEMNSNNIRGFTSAIASVEAVEINIVEGAKQVMIAVPAGKKVAAVKDIKAFGLDILSRFEKSTVSVGGADATSENIGAYAKDYNVYVYSPATALGENTYTVSIVNE